MKTQVVKPLPVFLLVILLLAASAPIHVSAQENRPAIEVLKGSPPKNYPLRVYVYQQAFMDPDGREPLPCEWTQDIISTFYEVLDEFHGVVTRFIDEHPEYRELALIHFVNTLSPEQADITFKVVSWIPDGFVGYASHFSDGRVEIRIACRLADRGQPLVFNVIFHELVHALGLGHARQNATSDGYPELMASHWSNTATRIRIYPSTLDLHAIYVIHFGTLSGNVITLPPGLQYKMIIPYNVELQRLKEENERLKEANEKLWEHLRNISDTIKYLDNESQRLRRENQDLRILNEALEEQLADLWGRLQTADIIISRLQGENEMLRANLSSCASLGLELGEKCNQTIRDLVNKYNNLSANYSLCLDYLARYYSNAQWLKTWMWIIAAAGLISVLTAYFTMKRHIRKLEKELEEAHKRLETLHGQERRS